MQLNILCHRSQGSTHSTRAAAKVHDHGASRGHRRRFHTQELRCFTDQQFRTTAGHENPGFHSDSKSAELCPAQNMLQRKASNPLINGLRQLTRRKAGGEQ
ncbi:hypothetical protein GCM10009589_30660 [Arthrobacter pascens]